MHIVTLTTCHNRRECTLAVLRDLHNQDLPEDVSLTHVVVDDGSTDGTSQAVRGCFPDVEIVTGGGQLYWAGGMRHGWTQSVSKKSFDCLFAYNDDVRLFPTALADLIRASALLKLQQKEAHVVVGSFKSNDGKITSYGGRRRKSKWHPFKFAVIIEPNGLLQEADTLNMNGALIARAALNRIGFLSDYFTHSGADYEFGLKLIKAGGSVYVSENHIGSCDPNPDMDLPDERITSLGRKLTLLFDNKREPFRQRLTYYRKHGGLFWPLFWISPYITVWIKHVWYRWFFPNRHDNQ